MTKNVFFWFMIAALASGTESIFISFSNNQNVIFVSGIILFSIAFAAFFFAIILMIKNKKNKKIELKEIKSDQISITDK